MGVSGAKWCDFIVYTNKVIYVEKIAFDPVFWQNLRTEKASCANFYSNPIVGPVGANDFVGCEFNSNKDVSWDGYQSNFCEP